MLADCKKILIITVPSENSTKIAIGDSLRPFDKCLCLKIYWRTACNIKRRATVTCAFQLQATSVILIRIINNLWFIRPIIQRLIIYYELSDEMVYQNAMLLTAPTNSLKNHEIATTNRIATKVDEIIRTWYMDYLFNRSNGMQ